MGLIKRIEDIGNFRSFENFSMRENCPDFKRYNLIYGLNGSGKTTLADFFRELESRFTEGTDFILDTDNGIVHKDNYIKRLSNIRVFNREYINSTISRYPEGIKPVYYIGEENRKNALTLKQMEEDICNLEVQIGQLQVKNEESKNKIEKVMSAAAKDIKLLLTSNRSNYNTYNRRNLEKAYDSIKHEFRRHLLNAAELQNYILKQRSNLREIIDWRPLELNDTRVILDYVRRIIHEFPTNRVIEKLKYDDVLSKWVKEGYDYHTKHALKTCQFCGNALPDNLLADIEQHFDRSYNELIGKIEAGKKRLKEKIDIMGRSTMPDEGLLYEEMAQDYNLSKLAYIEYVEQYKQFLKDMFDFLDQKQRNVLERPIIDNFEKYCINCTTFDQPIPAITAIIERHNAKTRSFDSEISNTRRLIEMHKISEIAPMILGYEEESIRHKEQLQELALEKANKLMEFNRLRTLTYNTRMPAELINSDLVMFFPDIDITLEVVEAGYNIKRNSEIAQNLSYGEVNTIALIYFTRSLLDASCENSDVIVIMDDPVVGLDAQRCARAVDYFKKHLLDMEQVFILTHDEIFNKEIADWLSSMPNDSQSFVLDRDAGLGVAS